MTADAQEVGVASIPPAMGDADDLSARGRREGARAMNDKTTEPPRVERQIEALAKALLPKGWTGKETATLTMKWATESGEVGATVVATVPSLGASPEVTWTIREHATGCDAADALLALRDDLAAHMRARRDELTATLAGCGVGKGNEDE